MLHHIKLYGIALTLSRRMTRSLVIALNTTVCNPSRIQLIHIQNTICTLHPLTPFSIRYTVLEDNDVIRSDRIRGGINNLNIVSTLSQINYNEEHDLDVTTFIRKYY